MTRILVTGASGFLGQHVLSLLERQEGEVHAVSRSEVQASESNVIWHQADLFDSAHTEQLLAEVRPDKLIHLAWEATPGSYWNSLANYRWVEATLALVRLFREYGGRKLVVAGSCAEYDWSLGIMRETSSELRYDMPYPASKNALEKLLRSYAEQTKLELAWGRLFFVYGPGEDERRLIPSVIHALLEDREARCSSGIQKRDYIYVEDAAEALVLLAEDGHSGIFNIGSGQAVAVRELVEQIADQFPDRRKPNFGALASSDDYPLVEADISGLRLIGWEPRTSIDKGVMLASNWWTERKAKNGHDL